MPLVSGGRIKMAATGQTWSSANGFAYDGPGPHPLGDYLGRSMAYDKIYERHLFPAVAVNKLVGLHGQLPDKVYRREIKGRSPAPDSPLGRIIAKPSDRIQPYHFWAWFRAMRHIHGRSFARKQRASDGTPVNLSLIHPTRMRYGAQGGETFVTPGFGAVEESGHRWWYRRSDMSEVAIPRREFIYWPAFNPSSPELGLSPFEPLRDTLENEAGARAANAAMWRNGGKHSMLLKHPGVMGDNRLAAQRLADQYQARHGGVDNWNRPLVLEENMDAVTLTMSNEELQYIDARYLNREEVAACYDLPPTSLQDYRRSTFSNITESHRGVYKLTMPPLVTSFEEMIEFDLRDGSFGEGDPDFGEAFFHESDMNAVMRGDHEKRIESYARAIQTGQMTPAEVRELENREFIEGSDTLFLNGAVVPIDEAAAGGRNGTGSAVSEDGGAGGGPGAISSTQDPTNARSLVMGRLSRPASLDDIDIDKLVEGLDPAPAAAVQGAVDIARYGDLTVPELRQIIKEIGL